MQEWDSIEQHRAAVEPVLVGFDHLCTCAGDEAASVEAEPARGLDRAKCLLHEEVIAVLTGGQGARGTRCAAGRIDDGCGVTRAQVHTESDVLRIGTYAQFGVVEGKAVGLHVERTGCRRTLK